VVGVQRISLNVDRKAHVVEVEPDKPLLYTLRDECGLNNPRFGCGLAQCGACTLHLDGRPIRSCILPTVAAKDREITTIVGLGTPERPHPLQAAYIEEQVPQCGMCTNGFLMTGAALLRDNPKPSRDQIRSALADVKCRCGTHVAIMQAMLRASGQGSA
jgi:aerobic-type carbon monoxide dehydrogenase small subunit (CoxS/CutS family)